MQNAPSEVTNQKKKSSSISETLTGIQSVLHNNLPVIMREPQHTASTKLVINRLSIPSKRIFSATNQTAKSREKKSKASSGHKTGVSNVVVDVKYYNKTSTIFTQSSS
jgi:hypothetical protein